jgi:hypothetical protein
LSGTPCAYCQTVVCGSAIIQISYRLASDGSLQYARTVPRITYDFTGLYGVSDQ